MYGFKKALFITDNGFTTQSMAFTKALRFASDQGASLDFVCVLPDLSALHYSTSDDKLKHMRDTIIKGTQQRIKSELAPYPSTLSSDVKVVVGKEYVEVIRQVLIHDYDVVIKQAENPSWLQSIFGSSDLHLLRKCPCAVWLIHEHAKDEYQNIAAAIDFSDDDIEAELNFRIAHHAALFSTEDSAQMHVISAYDSSVAGFASLWANDPDKFESEFLLEEDRRRRFASAYLIEQMQKQSDDDAIKQLDIQQHVIKGKPVNSIPAKVNELAVDLVVMGTVGRSGIMGMLIGNTAESVLLQLSSSVLALKPKDFVCPITPAYAS
ncbi:universal stress protein [Glaciecola sp. XM2]|uniref:universal stress protein n=1 Tax=Glaciecola sp. XM2 TaxID=1914931 RepID=UPI001BDF4C3A|nr:universal stress protein [Glaciecola sp. XM2]MBT1452402.1 universal stress protein [Glaciecola sp. XM2]